MVDEDNDQISKYCLGKLTNPKPHSNVEFGKDVLIKLIEKYQHF